MKFSEVIKEFTNNGKLIRRKCWDDKRLAVRRLGNDDLIRARFGTEWVGRNSNLLADRSGYKRLFDILDFPYKFSLSDILANDWEYLNVDWVQHDFEVGRDFRKSIGEPSPWKDLL